MAFQIICSFVCKSSIYLTIALKIWHIHQLFQYHYQRGGMPMHITHWIALPNLNSICKSANLLSFSDASKNYWLNLVLKGQIFPRLECIIQWIFAKISLTEKTAIKIVTTCQMIENTITLSWMEHFILSYIKKTSRSRESFSKTYGAHAGWKYIRIVSPAISSISQL